MAAVFFSANFVFAQNIGLNYASNTGLDDGGGRDIRNVLVDIVRYAITFIGLIAVIIIMYSGFLWMTSGGDPNKVANARKTLINSAIGLVIAISAFAIVTFIANLIGDGLTGSGLGSPSSPRIGRGYGVLGACTVSSVYPEPDQRDVARNESIIVTFKKAVDIDTMYDGAGPNIDTDVIKIFHKADEEDCVGGGPCPSLISEAIVSTTDNKTFFITPTNYLGSASEIIWHSVYMSNDIEEEETGNGVFDDCRNDYLLWSFEVSNRLDLAPPQVKDNMFPAPDNERDTQNTLLALQASGTIQVLGRPAEFVAASEGVTNNPGVWEDAVIDVDDNCLESGNYQVSIDASNVMQAQLRRDGILLGSAATNIDTVVFSQCNLNLTLVSSDFATECTGGCIWDADVSGAVLADTLTVGSTVYQFGSGVGQILTDANNNTTAENIRAAIDGHPDIDATRANNIITVTATVAGTGGNNILLDTSNPSDLVITPMANGSNVSTVYTTMDRSDKARNAVIKINFNEAVNPLTLSGSAFDLQDYIRVKCIDIDGAACPPADADNYYDCNDGSGLRCLRGRFEISNQYKTVEFVSNNLCGVNGCGEQIYCLPGDAHLAVELAAADLALCPAPIDCNTRSPYTACNTTPTGDHCQNPDGFNLPTAGVPANGVADMANNSLDGNRDTHASGSITFFNQNSPSLSEGDDFVWSFYIKDVIDIGAPVIESVSPTHNNPVGAELNDPVNIYFSKLMMSSSLRTGAVNIFNGRDYFTHKAINLWNFSSQPLGYWITSNSIDTSSPLDGEPDKTTAIIKHSRFQNATSYRAQVGSGVKDIYQNCYKPSAVDDPACAANEANPNCCPNGVAGPMNAVDGTGLNSEGNCSY